MWMHCDDAGIHPDSPRRLKMECFPGDDITIDDVDGWVDELVDNSLLSCFVVESQRFLQVTGWHHQRIDKPSYKYPSPERGEFVDRSGNGRGAVDEHSTTAHPRSGGESTGVESRGVGTGVESNGGEDTSCAPTNGARPINGAARRFDAFWTQYPSGHRKAKKRCREIWVRKRLDERADEILADLARRPEQDDQWVQGYIPNPSTYLNQERWGDDYRRPGQGQRGARRSGFDDWLEHNGGLGNA